MPISLSLFVLSLHSGAAVEVDNHVWVNFEQSPYRFVAFQCCHIVNNIYYFQLA